MFLALNVIAMLICSTMVIIRKHSNEAVAGLLGVVVTQALGYGLIFDLNFFLRNLSVMGGLIMVLSDSWVRKKFAPAGLPQIDEKDRKMYLQLAGRILLIFLFVGFVFAGDWSVSRIVVSALGFVACVMVVVGFKAKFSAIMLVLILSVFNVLVNNFWTVCHNRLMSIFYLLIIFSSTSTTLRRILPNMIFSKSSRSCMLLSCSSFPGSVMANDLFQWRSTPACEYGTRPVQRRREEESLLGTPRCTAHPLSRSYYRAPRCTLPPPILRYEHDIPNMKKLYHSGS